MGVTTDVPLRLADNEIQVLHPTRGWVPLRSLLADAHGAMDPVPEFEVSGQVYSPVTGYTQPLTADVTVYVMSEVHVQFAEPQPTLGNDDNDGLSKGRPLRSMDGVRKMIARRGIAGKRILVRLAGGGWPSVSDPWDGQCTSVRYYLVRDLYVGGSEAFANSFAVEGPRNMVNVQGPLTVNNLAGDGLRTKWDTSDTIGSLNSARGLWLRCLRNGKEVTQPVQVTGNTAGGSASFWTDNGPNTAGSVYRTDDTYYLVSCGAELVSTNSLPDDVGAADGVAAVGLGAADINARPSNGINPRYTFERLAFERFNACGAMGLSFVTCLFYNTTTFRQGWHQFKGCIVNNQGGLDYLAESRTIGNTSETNEFNGRSLIVASAPYPDVTADPMWPERGGIGLYVTQGGMRIGGPHARGVFRIFKSLSVEGELTVQGPGSALIQPVNTNILFVRNAGGVGLRCRDGGLAMIDDASGLVEITATSVLKVGIGAAIGLGTGAGNFREVGQWAGNFTRRLETNAGGKPTGDDSRICDSGTWSV